MTPDTRRWALLGDDTQLASPEARRQAAAMETEGYVQHDMDELTDGARMLMLSGHDGSVAPGVYHRYGDPTDAHGSREEHVLEAYPESPYASKITAQGAQHQPEKGNPIPRVAFFVGAQPEHHSHYAQFYTARDQMHRAQAAKE